MISFIKSVLAMWYKIPQKLRFLLVGGFNTVVCYAFFAVFLWILGKEHYQFCLVLAWVLSSIISYTTQKVFVFCTKGNWCKEYGKCCMSWMVGYGINALVLEVAVKWVGWNVYWAQAFAIAITTVVTYLLFKHFAFKAKRTGL